MLEWIAIQVIKAHMLLLPEESRLHSHKITKAF